MNMRDARVPELITPHGDRKPLSRGGQSGFIRPSSLPLMGIENRSTRLRIRAFHLGSLPLMGIENQGRAARSARRRPGDSLPLMGIENTLTDAARPHVGPVLITPHGDRKRGGALSRLDASRLITPHGDRKPMPRPYGLVRPAGAHYPSWGSKTGDNAARPVGLRRLITPHGDRKLQPRRSPASMGIRAIVSLPLMGIENPWRHQLARGMDNLTHYPSWGSKTLSDERT